MELMALTYIITICHHRSHRDHLLKGQSCLFMIDGQEDVDVGTRQDKRRDMQLHTAQDNACLWKQINRIIRPAPIEFIHSVSWVYLLGIYCTL